MSPLNHDNLNKTSPFRTVATEKTNRFLESSTSSGPQPIYVIFSREKLWWQSRPPYKKWVLSGHRGSLSVLEWNELEKLLRVGEAGDKELRSQHNTYATRWGPASWLGDTRLIIISLSLQYLRGAFHSNSVRTFSSTFYYVIRPTWASRVKKLAFFEWVGPHVALLLIWIGQCCSGMLLFWLQCRCSNFTTLVKLDFFKIPSLWMKCNWKVLSHLILKSTLNIC